MISAIYLFATAEMLTDRLIYFVNWVMKQYNVSNLVICNCFKNRSKNLIQNCNFFPEDMSCIVNTFECYLLINNKI